MPEMGRSMEERAPRGQAARKLSTHQQAVLIQILLTFPDEAVGVCCLPRASGAAITGDGQSYAEDFLTVFKAINWTVDGVEKTENLPAAASGLAIVVKEAQVPPSGEALRDGLRIYQIEAEIVADRMNLCGVRKFVLAVTQG